MFGGNTGGHRPTAWYGTAVAQCIEKAVENHRCPASGGGRERVTQAQAVVGSGRQGAAAAERGGSMRGRWG